MTDSWTQEETGDAPEIATSDFDHHSADFAANSLAVWQKMRDEAPVVYSSHHGGFWTLTRYEDVARASRDDHTFSSAHDLEGGPRLGVAIPPVGFRSGVIEMDPPQSLALRRALNPFLSPAAVAKVVPYATTLAQQAIDRVIASGRADLILDFAHPVPALTMLHMLGFPAADWRRYSTFFSQRVGELRDRPEYKAVQDEAQWVLGSFAEIVADRRHTPRDDGLTWLINRSIDGNPMSDELAVETLMSIIGGAFDTTTALLANSLVYLGENGEDRRRLLERPELVSSACEEFLRYFTPVQALARTVTTDCTVLGQQLKADDRVLLSWAAANHDEREFPEPDRIIIDRFPNRHAAFGLGTHRCIGSTLAREEFRIMLSEVLRRIPDYRILEDQAVKYTTIGIVNGWSRLPAEFTPGEPLGPLPEW